MNATLSPTRALPSRTSEGLAREIWENGFREECERIAIELNADKKKKVDTTKKFWDAKYMDYLRAKFIGARGNVSEFHKYQSAREDVWKLLYAHFEKPVQVPEIIARQNRMIQMLGENAAELRNDSKIKSLPPASEIKGVAGKILKRQLLKEQPIEPRNGSKKKSLPPASIVIRYSVSLERPLFGNAEYALLAALEDAARATIGSDVTSVHDKLLYALGTFKQKTAHRELTTWTIPYPKQTGLFSLRNGRDKDVLLFRFACDSAPSGGIAVLTEGMITGKPKQPIAQLLFGNPGEITSLVAFCDAQLQLLKPKHQLAAYYEAIKQRLLDGRSNAVLENRYCGCGCGEALTGNGKMKFVNGTHRKRAWKNRNNPDAASYLNVSSLKSEFLKFENNEKAQIDFRHRTG